MWLCGCVATLWLSGPPTLQHILQLRIQSLYFSTSVCLSQLRIASLTQAFACFSRPAEPSGLELRFRAPQRSRAGSSTTVERLSGAERVRATISSASVKKSGVDVANVGMCAVLEARPTRTEPGEGLDPVEPARRLAEILSYIYIYIFIYIRIQKHNC